MKSHSKLAGHIGKLFIAMVLAMLVGLLIGHPIMAPGVFLACYLVWQTYNSLRLYHYLQLSDSAPPKSFGMWANMGNHINQLKSQHSEKQRHYKELINDFEVMAQEFPDAILVIDEKDMIRWCNKSARQLLKLDELTRGSARLSNLIRDPGFADWLAAGDDERGTMIIDCPTDHGVILQLSSVRVRENQRMLIMRDVTEIQHTERLRRDLIANVSHELRTPLTVLLGYLEILKAQPKEAKPKAIKRMLKQARQMHALLEDLLELSRLQSTENHDNTGTVDVPSLLAQLREQAEELSRGEHDLRFDISPGLYLRGVESDLKSAFQNLIVNAINYTPDKGVIRVSWQETPEHLVLSVRDNGVGIPYQDIPRLTERFYRVGDDRNRKTGGTGLGLAIVKHVLMNHDAHLEISSEVSKGSDFRCLFPLNRKA